MTLWCESCGEAEQEISTAEAGLCGDCFGRAVSESLSESGLFDRRICGHPLFHAGRMAAICVLPHGEEHEHPMLRF